MMRSIVGGLVVVTCAAVVLAATDPPRVPETLPLSHGTRVVVFAPHPDDETIAAGGLIRHLTAMGATVHVVFVTSGDGYPDAVRAALHGRAPSARDYLAYGRLRRNEALEAGRRLGIPPAALHFLAFPDGGLDTLWQAHWERDRPYTSPYTATDRPPYPGVLDRRVEYDGQDLTAAISRVLTAVRPTLVVMPHPEDTHLDHAATARFVVEAVAHLRARHVLPRNVEVMAYLVHDPLWPPTVAETATLPPPSRIHDTRWVSIPLSADEQAAKTQALQAYASQLAVMPGLLRRFLRPNELLGRVDSDVLVGIAARH
jgi:LmbE family N-acetylglucosaminyl deacetylase